MNTTSQTVCPNCGKSLTGLFGYDLVDPAKVQFINNHGGGKSSSYCTSCSKPFLKEIASRFKAEKSKIEQRITQIIHVLPVITSDAPIGWNYEVLDMVNAQTTTGTGFMTELSRSFNDMLGGTSKMSNDKIKISTATCKAALRLACLRKGGNAIISTDIDFNEIGTGSTNMLMVAMAGTAIVVKDLNNFAPGVRDRIRELVDLNSQLSAILEAEAER